jgi:uncharacterized protein
MWIAVSSSIAHCRERIPDIAQRAVEAQANRKEHGVSFEEATVLLTGQTDYLEIYDEEQSDDEDRFIAVGRINRGMIVVAYTEPEADVTRFISVRMATKKEQQRFEQFEGGLG